MEMIDVPQIPQEATSELRSAFSLVYRGLAADAQRKTLADVFGKLLRLPAAEVDGVFFHPPLTLTVDLDREKIRRHQMGLARLGCITTIEPAQQLDRWTIPDELTKALDSSDQSVLALLQFKPSPGFWRLKQLAQQLDDGLARALNHGQLLILRPTHNLGGAGRWLKAIHTQMSQSWRDLGGEAVASAFAVYPDDGDRLEKIMPILQGRIDEAPTDANVSAIPEPPAWILAGKTWRAVFNAGSGSLNDLPISTDERHELLAQWPLEQTSDRELGPVTDVPALLKDFRQRETMRRQHREDILQRFSKLDRLPSLPAVAMKVYQMAQDNDSDPAQLAAAVEQDPSLSTRLLTMVNSPYFGLRGKVDSIAHALVILGREELAHLALLLSGETVFRGLSNTAGQRLWRHSAVTAGLAKALAHKLDHPQASTLYTAALLHDVGKIFLLSFAAHEMADIEELSNRYELPSYELEREWFGHDHASLGAAMLRRWGLPESLSRIVQQHHGCPTSVSLSRDASLIALADHMAHSMLDEHDAARSTRLRRHQQQLLPAELHLVDLESIDLLAEDLRPQVRELMKSQAA